MPTACIHFSNIKSNYQILLHIGLENRLLAFNFLDHKSSFKTWAMLLTSFILRSIFVVNYIVINRSITRKQCSFLWNGCMPFFLPSDHCTVTKKGKKKFLLRKCHKLKTFYFNIKALL